MTAISHGCHGHVQNYKDLLITRVLVVHAAVAVVIEPVAHFGLRLAWHTDGWLPVGAAVLPAFALAHATVQIGQTIVHDAVAVVVEVIAAFGPRKHGLLAAVRAVRRLLPHPH